MPSALYRYGPCAHGEPVADFLAGDTHLWVVRCLTHQSPALVVDGPEIKGRGIMLCFEGGEADQVSAALQAITQESRETFIFKDGLGRPSPEERGDAS